MKKKIAILGSTGSIGKSTLDIIRKDKKNFEVVFLSANNNYKKLIQQAKEFSVKNVLIKNKILPYLIGKKEKVFIIQIGLRKKFLVYQTKVQL